MKNKKFWFWFVIVGIPMLFVLIGWYINFELVSNMKWWEVIISAVAMVSSSHVIVTPLFIIYFWKPE